MENNFHTLRITGHLIFDSKHRNFRTAFREFIEKEGMQLQVTDMEDANAPSMEIGVKLSVSTEFINFSNVRYADTSNLPKVQSERQHKFTPAATSAERPVEKSVENFTDESAGKFAVKAAKGPVNPKTGSDLAFY